MRKPRIFVSSTCYDLEQIRDDLKQFIEGQGYEAVLSEHRSFPVHPDKTTIENSKEAVRKNCDVLVLIVGGRYGTIDKRTNRSITNGEYLEACVKGAPIYAFVIETVNTLLPSWEANPAVTHPDIESNRVFEFVRQLKDSGSWVFPFKNATDITDTLRVQFAYLFLDGLEKRGLLTDAHPLIKLGLRGRALQLALNQERLWEYELFVELLTNEIEQRAGLKQDLEVGFATNIVVRLSTVQEVGSWTRDQLGSCLKLIDSWNKMVPMIGESFGPLGTPGDPAKIAYVTSRFGVIYQSALEWGLAFHHVEVPTEADRLRELLSHFMDDILGSFSKVLADVLAIIDEFSSKQPGGETEKREIVWTITVARDLADEVDAEIKRLQTGR